MCHINIKNLFSLPNPKALPLLLVLKQAQKKDLSLEIASLVTSDEDLEALEKEGYIKYIKGKSKDNIMQRMRLDKKGTTFLNSLESAEVEEQDIVVFDWLAKVYKKNEKQIGNGKKTKRLIASFREKSGIEKNNLLILCNTFINDEEEQEWSFKLEYVFWKPQNVYQTRFILEDSRLWKYYNKRKDFFDKSFK